MATDDVTLVKLNNPTINNNRIVTCANGFTHNYVSNGINTHETLAQMVDRVDVRFIKSYKPIRRSSYDIDAANYIRSVESADGQALEIGVKDAINAFVVGCKSDGIWDAIKAACIMAGARTLTGALVPLVGPAPTNFNFEADDYNRKTGLGGDGIEKYLDINRNNNADPQNSKHLSVHVTSIGTNNKPFLMAGDTQNGASSIFHRGIGTYIVRNNATTIYDPGISFSTGFIGCSRSEAASFSVRLQGANYTASITSQTPVNENYLLFKTPSYYGDGSVAFYSIGESLDLALLDTRVTSLMAQLAFAINTGLSPIGYSSETINYVNAGYAAGGTLA